MTKLGFNNPKSKDWFFDQPQAMKKLIQLGIEDLNMFGKPMFLHDRPLIKLPSSESVPNVKIGDSLGNINLEKTTLPENAPNQGLLVVALDPLQKINDADRLDNVFVQYITLDGDVTSQLNDPTCDVFGIGKSQGSILIFLQDLVHPHTHTTNTKHVSSLSHFHIHRKGPFTGHDRHKKSWS